MNRKVKSFKQTVFLSEQCAVSKGLLLTFDIPKGAKSHFFSSVIWLTWRCPLWWLADVCIELCNSFRCRFCKVPPPRNCVMAAL